MFSFIGRTARGVAIRGSLPRSRWRTLPAVVTLAVLGCCSPARARRKRIVVAGGDRFPPITFRDAQGKAAGLDADTWRLWSRKTGVAADLRVMDWADAIPALRAGKVDVATGVSYTPERAKHLDFSTPYAGIDTYIFFHESIGGVRGLDDLAGFPVGVVKGGNIEEFLRREAPKLRLVTYVRSAPAVCDSRRLSLSISVPCFDQGLPASKSSTQDFQKSPSDLQPNSRAMSTNLACPLS